MATDTKTVDYPTSDGRPMAETDLHRDVMMSLIQTLEDWFTDAARTYVSGNMLIYYAEGDKRRHVAPDVFVVHGVAKKKRDYYLFWEEAKGPALVIEVTSKSTRREDMKKKWELYRDVLKVKEYFLFDPTEDYLHPRLQGFRLLRGVYEAIDMVDGRLPSHELGLHLEASGSDLRLFNPQIDRWLLTLHEKLQQEHDRAEREKHRAEREKHRADRLEEELERLRRRRNGHR